MEVNTHLTGKAQRDYLLVRQALEQGSQQAYAELLNNYRDTLYYIMLKMTLNPTDAEDLTIEAFGKAFRNLEAYTPNFAFSIWLFRIAANNCIDFLRKNQRIHFADGFTDEEDQELVLDYPVNIPSTSLDPEEKAIEKQKIRLMREVVQRLKPHYRNMVELRYFQELSYEEIAELMSLPLGTVKAQLFRARELLYSILRPAKDRI